MSILKFLFSAFIMLFTGLFITESAWAWGPAIHTVISCSILDGIKQILPAIASVIETYSLEYIYGSMAADFFIGKGNKKKDGHSHNWESGFRLLEGANDEREASYAYGFLSHLAADVIAHNYFVPDLIYKMYALKKIGHLYSEVVADRFVGPLYTRIAKDILSMEQLDCDDMLKSAVTRSRVGLKARRQFFTQTVKVSDYLFYLPRNSLKNSKPGYGISREYMIFMIELSYRLVKDLLSYPDSSPCLSHDPIGSHNLRLASKNNIISKLVKNQQTVNFFPIDQELLEL